MGNTTSLSLRRRRARASPGELLYTKPSGLYPSCAWDEKHVARLILRGDLAPRYPGQDERSKEAPEECPICLLCYPTLNTAKCCQAMLCSECYLQVRPPRHSKEPCPFCKHRRLEAVFKGPRDPAELAKEEADEKRASLAMRRAQEAAVTAGPVVNAGRPASAPTGPSDHPPPLHRDAASEVSSSAASAAAQFGNSAASAASDESESTLSVAPPSVDVATMRRLPGGMVFPEPIPSASQLAIFQEEREERDIALLAFDPPPPRYTAEATNRALIASHDALTAPFISRYSDEMSEAIRRSILEQ